VTRIKKLSFLIIKIALSIVVFLTLILFFYSALFYEPSSNNQKITEEETIEKEIIEETKLEASNEDEEKEKQRLEEEEIQKKVTEDAKKKKKIQQIKTTIQDGIFVTIGNKAITKSDIVNKIKIILILNNMSYSDEIREELQQMAVKQIIKQTVKEIEIAKYDYLDFNPADMNTELKRLAGNLNVDVETLENICKSNGVDFSAVKNQLETDLLWNSLIYYLYRNRISVNLSEIDEQLKLNQDKKDFEEFLISEIIIKSVEKDKIQSRVKEVKQKIETEGFESTAMSLSISKTAVNGGDLGWVNENAIAKKFKSIILNTPIGGISDSILLSEGILIFKVRDKRKIAEEINLEDLKEQLVMSEKTKILNMYSLSHYDNLRRTIAIEYLNE